MSHPQPPIENDVLIEVIRREYGIQVAHLTYLKRAWIAYCYAADSANGQRYVGKFYADACASRSLASDRDFYLSLTHSLCTGQTLPTVACPVRARWTACRLVRRAPADPLSLDRRYAAGL
jgi:hypothetical protein